MLAYARLRSVHAIATKEWRVGESCWDFHGEADVVKTHPSLTLDLRGHNADR